MNQSNTSNNNLPQSARSLNASQEHALGGTIARYLDESAARLPYRVTQRLENARKGALAAMPTSVLSSDAARTIQVQNSSATLSGPNLNSVWRFFGMAFPALLLAAGLFVMSSINDHDEAEESASIDAALLIDEVPISAYADRGFGVHVHNVQQ